MEVHGKLCRCTYCNGHGFLFYWWRLPGRPKQWIASPEFCNPKGAEEAIAGFLRGSYISAVDVTTANGWVRDFMQFQPKEPDDGHLEVSICTAAALMSLGIPMSGIMEHAYIAHDHGITTDVMRWHSRCRSQEMRGRHMMPSS